MATVNLETKKLEIIKAVISATTEEAIVQKIAQILVSSKSDLKEKEESISIETLGTWADGTAVTAASFYKRLAKNAEDKKQGKYLTQEEAIKETETW